MKLLTVLLLFAAGALLTAQTPTHQVTLTWTDSANPAGTSYSVYRFSGTCANPQFVSIASGVAIKTYVDANIAPGTYCYTVTAVNAGSESAPATPVLASVPSTFPPGKILIIVQ